MLPRFEIANDGQSITWPDLDIVITLDQLLLNQPWVIDILGATDTTGTYPLQLTLLGSSIQVGQWPIPSILIYKLGLIAWLMHFIKYI